MRPEQCLGHAADSFYQCLAWERLEEGYGEIRVPLGTMHGTAGRSGPIEQARRVDWAVPDLQRVETLGLGHEAMSGHAPETLRAIRVSVE